MRAVWYDRQGPADEVYQDRRAADAGTRPAAGPGPAGSLRRQSIRHLSPPRRGAGGVSARHPEQRRRRRRRQGRRGRRSRWVGKRVWLYNGQRNGRWMGTAAEFIALDVDLVTELPGHVSFAEGATLGIPCMTAHGCVFASGPIQGQTLLVTGGAGAVGHYAVQLAAWAGARVIATVSSDEKAERARRAARNASSITAPRMSPRAWPKSPAAWASTTSSMSISAAIWRPRWPRCASAAASPITPRNGALEPKINLRALMGKNLTIRGFVLPTSPHPDRKRAQTDIASFIRTPGRILSVAARFPLYETAAAHVAWRPAARSAPSWSNALVEPGRCVTTKRINTTPPRAANIVFNHSLTEGISIWLIVNLHWWLAPTAALAWAW